MKNNQISAGQIPHLVRVTADLFKVANQEIDANIYKAKHMHFVVDLLKDLVDTAYPIEDNDNKALICALDLKPIKESDIKDLENGFAEIAKMMKKHQSPKAGEF